jgi:alkylhydroperoxidase family enzyme
MTDARIAPLEPPYAEDVGRTLERLMGNTGLEPLRVFRVVAHHPQILERFRSTGTYLLNFGTVAARERELVILRTCARCGSRYEWGVHVAVYGPAVGLRPEQIAATTGSVELWSGRERLLIELADALHDNADVGDRLWQRLAARWSPAQLIELITIAGQYHLVSFLTNALQIAPEEWAPRPQASEMMSRP